MGDDVGVLAARRVDVGRPARPQVRADLAGHAEDRLLPDLRTADWNARVIGGDLADEITTLEQQPGKDLLLTGGSTLAGALTDLGLIDEYHIVVHPVVLGGGRPLFRDPRQRITLRLAGSRVLGGRTVLLHYQRGDA